MNLEPDHTCPLCNGKKIMPYHRDKVRDYLQCGACDLVFVPPGQHISTAAEKAYYDLHENHVDDPGYRRFLDRLFTPLNTRLAPHSNGLDFGSGPGPALPAMFREAGHRVTLYDPHYAPDNLVLADPYDFITLSEVAEHLAAPGVALDKLWQCLNPGGWLAIMTKRVRDQDAFKTWHYITDPTHIAYFSEATFSWLAERWSAESEISGADVVLFKKGAK
jgi:SAM-dependent methyltransferase